MSRIFLTILLALSVCHIAAQKTVQGDLNFLKGHNKLHVTTDFSETQMLGYTDVQFHDWIKAFAKDSLYYMKCFYNGLVDEMEDRFLLVGNQPDAEYQLCIHVNQIDSKGTVYSTCVFSRMQDSEPLCTIQVVGKGGRMGTLINLFGDGMESTGEKLGKLLKKY